MLSLKQLLALTLTTSTALTNAMPTSPATNTLAQDLAARANLKCHFGDCPADPSAPLDYIRVRWAGGGYGYKLRLRDYCGEECVTYDLEGNERMFDEEIDNAKCPNRKLKFELDIGEVGDDDVKDKNEYNPRLKWRNESNGKVYCYGLTWSQEEDCEAAAREGQTKKANNFQTWTGEKTDCNW